MGEVPAKCFASQVNLEFSLIWKSKLKAAFMVHTHSSNNWQEKQKSNKIREAWHPSFDSKPSQTNQSINQKPANKATANQQTNTNQPVNKPTNQLSKVRTIQMEE